VKSNLQQPQTNKAHGKVCFHEGNRRRRFRGIKAALICPKSPFPRYNLETKLTSSTTLPCTALLLALPTRGSHSLNETSTANQRNNLFQASIPTAISGKTGRRTTTTPHFWLLAPSIEYYGIAGPSGNIRNGIKSIQGSPSGIGATPSRRTCRFSTDMDQILPIPRKIGIRVVWRS